MDKSDPPMIPLCETVICGKMTVMHGEMEDMPIVRFPRLYWLMLRPWFSWRLRHWIERTFISRWNARHFRTETKYY